MMKYKKVEHTSIHYTVPIQPLYNIWLIKVADLPNIFNLLNHLNLSFQGKDRNI